MILTSPSYWMLALSLGAMLAYALPALWPGLARQQAKRLLWLGWLTHGLTLLGLMVGPAHFGFAPALSVTAWLVLTAYVVESQFFPQLRGRWALGLLGALAVLLALVFPGTHLHMQASAWLPLHWALGLAAYGLFAAAVIHGAMLSRTETAIRQAGEGGSGLPLLTLERLMFRFVVAGFVLLTATLLAGWLFGEQLYGSASWRWDHKKIFALLSWLTFAVLLWGRQRWGWRGRRAVRVLYIGAGFLLLSYAGSRFVLEVLLGRAA